MRIKTTEEFDKAYEFIFTCSQDFYSQSVLKGLRNSLKNKLKILNNNPLIGGIEPSLENTGIEFRRIVIRPYFKVIYIMYDDCIYLTDIWDTRRDPSLLSKNYN